MSAIPHEDRIRDEADYRSQEGFWELNPQEENYEEESIHERSRIQAETETEADRGTK